MITKLKEPGRQGKPLVSSGIVTDDTWHRVGLVWDGANKMLYTDGVLVASDTQSKLTGSDGGLIIGCSSTMAPGTFRTGLIDDVRIYSRAVEP